MKDEAIIAAIGEVGKVGVFTEPAGATAYAGMKKALEEGMLTGEDRILVLNTGNGLKDVRAALMAVKEAPVIAPNMDALKKHLSE